MSRFRLRVPACRRLCPAWLHAVLAGALLWTYACESSGTAVSPSATPTATTANLAITGGVNVLRSGYFADYVVTATMSDNTTQVVTRQAVLATNDPAVATLDANGRLNALGNGAVTLSASYQGQTTTRKITVVSDFGTRWSGTYVVRICDGSGIFETRHFCANPALQAPQRFSLDLKQGGANLDEISGLISLQDLPGAISGAVNRDGKLALSGSYVAEGNGGTFGISLLAWSSELSGGTGMSGSFVYDVSVAGEPGRLRLHNDIVTATKYVASTAPSGAVPLTLLP